MKKKITKCLECGGVLNGRIDQKFCSPYCKSSYHYELNKENDANFFKKVDVQLKLNRRILKRFTQSGQSQIKKELLVKEGFDFKYFTHYYKAKNGNVYLFSYEYGHRDMKDGKYMLITWQDYMGK
jgi:hypothetical protein